MAKTNSHETIMFRVWTGSRLVGYADPFTIVFIHSKLPLMNSGLRYDILKRVHSDVTNLCPRKLSTTAEIINQCTGHLYFPSNKIYNMS